MLAWTADDGNDRWIYHTIYPADVRNDRNKLMQFKNMEEIDAEANWNYDDQPPPNQLTMSQRTT